MSSLIVERQGDEAMADSVSTVPAAAPKRDFPFYRGAPRSISAIGWIVVLIFCALGFAALIAPTPFLSGQIAHWVAVLLFVVLPLTGLRIAAGPDWRAMFPRLRWRDVGIGLAFVPVTVLTSAAVAVFFVKGGMTAANPVIGMLARMNPTDLAVFLASTLPQLLGEEIITILPFLAVLTLLHQRLKLPRAAAILGAWIVSAVIFAALHLPTYGWHILQTLAVIGTARLALTLPFLITKNIWSSTIAHVTNDWLLFAVIGGLTALKANGAL